MYSYLSKSYLKYIPDLNIYDYLFLNATINNFIIIS